MELFIVLRRKPGSDRHSFIAFAASPSQEVIYYLVNKVGFTPEEIGRWTRIEAELRENGFFDLEPEIDGHHFRIHYLEGVSTFVSFTSEKRKLKG